MDGPNDPRGFSVKLPSEELQFLRSFARELGVRAVGAALRRLAAAARTLFHVPAYMVPRLREDIAQRRLTLLTYVQELLAHRYEELTLRRALPERTPLPHRPTAPADPAREEKAG